MSILIYTSVDNMLAAFGLGALAPNSVKRTTVFSTFVAAEATATLFGGLLRNTWLGHSAQLFEPAILPLYVLCAAAMIFRGISTRKLGSLGTLGVAIVLSLDNFIAAAGGQTDLSAAAVLLPAVMSGVTALPALEAGKFISTQMRRLWKLRPISAELRQRA